MLYEVITIEGREQVAAFLQEEERFDNLDWRDLKGDDYRKVQDERQRHYQRGYEISPALFAYRRYTQSGNDIELIDTYIDLLDDFRITSYNVCYTKLLRSCSRAYSIRPNAIVSTVSQSSSNRASCS